MNAERPSKTTIVVPVWDRYITPTLLHALASLRSQLPQPRVLVIDNASEIPLPDLHVLQPEPTPSAEGSTPPREPSEATLRIMRTPERLSLGAARNFGLAAVETPYVMFWDADDVMLSGTIDLLEHSLDWNPNLIATGAAIYESIDDQGGSGEGYRRHRWPRRWLARLTPRPRLLALVNSVWSIYPTTGATLFRTEVARAAGGFADALGGEDWTFGAALAFHGALGWSEEPARLYARHEDSVWGLNHSASHQAEHGRAVRARLASDPAVPAFVKQLLPLIAVAQRSATGSQALLQATRKPRQAVRKALRQTVREPRRRPSA